MFRPKGCSQITGAPPHLTTNQSIKFTGHLLALPLLALLFLTFGVHSIVLGQRVAPQVRQPPTTIGGGNIGATSNTTLVGSTGTIGGTNLSSTTTTTGAPNTTANSATTNNAVSVTGGGGTPNQGEAPLETGGTSSPSPSPNLTPQQFNPRLSSSTPSEPSRSGYGEPSVSPQTDVDERNEPASLPWMWIGIVAIAVVLILVEVVHRRSG